MHRMLRFVTAILLALPIFLASCTANQKESTLTRADMRFEEGDFRGAIVDYSLVLEEDPKLARAYNNRGVARLRLGDFQGALLDLDQALSLTPYIGEGYYNRALARFSLGEIDGAIADYTEAIRFTPRYSKALAGRGHARSKKGDLDGAITDFKASLESATEDWPDRKAVEAELARVQKARDGK